MAKRIIGTTPKRDGYRMPAEFEPQQGVWMLWPERNDNWRDGGKPRRRPLRMSPRPSQDLKRSRSAHPCASIRRARQAPPKNIRVVELESDDALGARLRADVPCQ